MIMCVILAFQLNAELCRSLDIFLIWDGLVVAQTVFKFATLLVATSQAAGITGEPTTL